MKDTKTTKLIKRRIKELNNASKHFDKYKTKNTIDEFNYLNF